MTTGHISAALFTDSDALAGTEYHMLALAEGLRELDVAVSFACPGQCPLADRARALGFTCIPVEKGRLVDLPAIGKLTAALAGGQINVLHAHNGRTMFTAAVAGVLARKGACLATQHFVEPDHTSLSGLKGMIFRLAHWWVARTLRCFITTSKAAGESMIARGVAADRVHVIPNGIAPPLSTRLLSPTQVRAAIGAAEAAPLVVSVSRLEREKDVACLVNAIAILRRRMPAVRCVVAGDGSQRPEIERLITEKQLAEHVMLLGHQDDPLSLMNAADCVVLSSVHESFGLVLVEAMAVGKAVVATRSGGPEEIVVDGETGFLVPRSDPEALTRAMERLLGDEELRRRMGQAGRVRFDENYTRQRMARSVLQVYEQALGVRR